VKTVICPELRKARSFPRLLFPGLLLSVLLSPALSSRMNLAAASNSSKDKEKEKPYALIAGTVWGPDNHPVYGITVKIRRASDKPKKVRWQVYSDHMGEFAQRVPAGEEDYIIWADLKGVKTTDGKPVRLAQPVTVHIYNDEREDTGLHLTH
jgi:hypothetical protein